MKSEKTISNRVFVLTAVIGSLLVMTMMTANSLWNTKQTIVATDAAVSAVSSFYLEAMADRRARIITNLVSNNFDQMEKAVSFIADEDITSQADLRENIGKVKALLGLNRLALVDEDNIVYTRYTTYTGGSRHPFLSDEHLKERVISIVSPYGSSKQLCLAIPVSDLTIMGKPFKACFIQLDISEIVDLLALDDQGKTHFALYSKNGSNLSGTELGPVIRDQNFIEALKGIVSESKWESLTADFENDVEGNLSFFSGDLHETLCYVPIRSTGWELAVLIRESVIQDQIRDISEKNLQTSRNQIIFTLVSVLLLAVILLIEVKIRSTARLRAEQETSRAFRDMANTDSLTGVRNKHAYSENETAINDQIQAGEIEKLAVVVGDINGLKIVNDTQGHSAGDRLIKDACAMICENIKHGAVFRIGGDEFAVILRDKGYDMLHETLDAFNRKVEENIAKKEVVVSLGYAVLTAEDRQLRDIFERADEMMYERKKQLKAMGAQTR